MFAPEAESRMKTIKEMSQPGIKPRLGDEHSLVAMAKSGQDEAFGELYRRHQRKSYCVAVRILRNQQDAEDAVQRAFQRALMNLKRFREDSSFSTWFTRIVINEALMLLRQRHAQEVRYENSMDAEPGDSAAEIADGGPTPEDILWENERRAALLQAVGRLRKKLRIVVFHRELKGLTSAETARLLGLTITTVKARTFHARRFLRKTLERKLIRVSLRVKPRKLAEIESQRAFERAKGVADTII